MSQEFRREASCSCGRLRATCRGEPVRVGVCHCLACQRRTGSPFAAQARFAREAVSIQGRSQVYTRAGDDGGRVEFHFCPDCGATVHYVCAEEPDLVAVPIGAFADPTFPAPTYSVYEARRHAWVTVPPSCVERQD